MKLLQYALIVSLISAPVCHGLSRSTAKLIGSGVGNGLLSLGCLYMGASTLFQSARMAEGKDSKGKMVFAEKNVFASFFKKMCTEGILKGRLFSPNVPMATGLLSLTGCSAYGGYICGKRALESFKKAYQQNALEQANAGDQFDNEELR